MLSDAYRWTAATGHQILPHYFPVASSFAAAHGVSADGNVVLCGESNVDTDEPVTFIWTAQEGLVLVPPPPGSIDESFPAVAISPDGRTVIGGATLPDGRFQACVWSREFGSRLLPAGTFVSTGLSTSSFDASRFTGAWAPASGWGGAFVWDSVHGVRDLKQLLLSLGASGVAPYQLLYSQISWDGRTIVGNARSVNWELYMATIPALCYGNCDGSGGNPVLNVSDFVCFQQRFAAGDPYANCDRSPSTPALNVLDFVCFQQKFAAGCP
jgi:uncharacterized membrane protein